MDDVDMAAIKPLLALAGDLVRRTRHCEDIDGGELQRLLAKHGLLYKAPALETDCQDEWAQEYGIEPGDTIYKLTDLGKAARDA